MLDILGNIDTVNYFIQDSINNLIQKPLEVKMNLYQGDGYVVHMKETKKNNVQFHINNQYCQQLCRIMIDKDGFILRYNPKFMFLYSAKTGLYKTNFFEETFLLQDMEATFFTQNTMFKFSTDVNFDHGIMIETLEKCHILYSEFIKSRA